MYEEFEKFIDWFDKRYAYNFMWNINTKQKIKVVKISAINVDN